ncbi:MAG TPA: hypothetical protein VGJ92_00660 [Methanocella sp.]|jgi:hypothetical protein
MESLTGRQKEVLMYFRESMNHNVEQGVKASEAANNIDAPLQEVLDACEKLDQLDLLDIDKRHMSGGKVKDLEAHISNKGIQTLQKDKGIPL